MRLDSGSFCVFWIPPNHSMSRDSHHDDARMGHEQEQPEEKPPPHPTLLEELRKGLVVVKHSNEKEARDTAVKIFEHVSEFPVKLQPSIRKAAAEALPSSPEDFLAAVGSATVTFLRGRSVEVIAVPPRTEPRWEFTKDWHGLDREVDTEDAAEVAIRCFPEVLAPIALPPLPQGNNRFITSRNFYSFFPLFTSPGAVSFLPLWLALCTSLGNGIWWSSQPSSFKRMLPWFSIKKLLLIPEGETFVEVFGHESASSIFPTSAKHIVFKSEEEERLEAESLAVLVRLRDIAASTSASDVEDLLKMLLRKGCERRHDERFVERRLRLLIDWKPSVLEDFRRQTIPTAARASRIPMVCIFYHYGNSMQATRKFLRIFETILQAGMTYFPLDLGFVFHNKRTTVRNTSAFCDIARGYGTQEISRIVHRQLVTTLLQVRSVLPPQETANHNKNHKNHNDSSLQLQQRQQSLLVAVATNDEICLDGLYMLLRSDPAAFVTAMTTTATTTTARAPLLPD
jgi:hypothetical protein